MSSNGKAHSGLIGQPVDRVDGVAKVTGAARYAAEFRPQGLAYGVVAQSTIPKGKIQSVDTSAAEKVPGVIAIFTCKNPPLKLTTSAQKEAAKSLSLLQNDAVNYAGQVIGLVVAESLESAQHSASLLKFNYQTAPFETNFARRLKSAEVPADHVEYKRGDVDQALKGAAVKVDQIYSTPTESHNPLEPFATVAQWNGGALTLYETTQGVFQSRRKIAEILGVAPDTVRVISHYLGGGFGCKLALWSHAPLTAMAARKLGRPVKVVLDRQQMYGPVGFRPATNQHIVLGANRAGDLVALRHEGINESAFHQFVESVTEASKMLYACPNVHTNQMIVSLDIGQPTWMRAPGHAPGSFALESALDELAYALTVDPLELRLRNYAQVDSETGLPWSSNSLRECYRIGAERFGWSKRNHAPRSMRDGKLLVGWGMATALHSCWRNLASARVELRADGTALVQSGCHDIGTGTYTIMTQIAAEKLSLPMERVTFELGDTNLPEAPLAGGSTTAGSVGNAVAQACTAALDKLIATAVVDRQSPLSGAKIDDIVAVNGELRIKGSAGKSESYQSLLSRTATGKLQATVQTKFGDEAKNYSMSTFGAQFAEVKIDPDLGVIQVSRFGGTYGAGRILNARTARSQMIGGITFGIGMALMEQTLIDHNLGRIINADFAEYHIPVNSDVANLDVFFVDEQDPHVNSIGVKGIGELGITGVAAAIANAVYHATGKRVRDLPITLDKILV